MYIMIRTQIQMPDLLYRQAKALADVREISLAELVRNGLEYMLRVSAEPADHPVTWSLPEPMCLGKEDPFADPDWRVNLHCGKVAEHAIGFATDGAKPHDLVRHQHPLCGLHPGRLRSFGGMCISFRTCDISGVCSVRTNPHGTVLPFTCRSCQLHDPINGITQSLKIESAAGQTRIRNVLIGDRPLFIRCPRP